MARMKRLQISLEPELDERLATVALNDGISKAEVVRRSLRETIKPLPPLEEDPFFGLTGSFEGPGLRPGESIDDVLYGPKGEGDDFR